MTPSALPSDSPNRVTLLGLPADLEEERLELSRLEALRSHQILDTSPEAAFDRITSLAVRLFGVPIAVVSLVDEGRQWFKSAIGIEVCQTSREASFCSRTIVQSGVMEVPDTLENPVFATNDLVVAAPFVRFYAGAPLVGGDGLVLGSLCVLDVVPRKLSETECQALIDLAAIVVGELELRRATRELQEANAARQTVQKALFDSQTRFKSAFEMSATGMALVSAQGRFLQVNGQICEMLGYSETQLLALTFQEITFPADLDADLEMLKRLLTGEITTYSIEKRYLRFDRRVIWAAISVAVVCNEPSESSGGEPGEPGYLVVQVQDISERRRIGDELRSSEARQAAIVETALDCIITIDAQSRIYEWNPAAERTFGFSRKEAMGSLLHQLIIPGSLRAAHQNGLKTWKLSGFGPILGKRLELPAMRADGQQITVELAVVPIPGSTPPLFTGHLRDISERRTIEERLRLLESVAVNAKDAILITEAEPVDLPGPRIRYVNRAFAEMTGYSAEEIIGQTPRILQGKDTSTQSRAKIRAALQAWKPVVVEILNYKKDGTPFWVELSITPVANEKGCFTHWISIQRDITQSREIVDALRESEGRYGRIATNVPGMVYQFVLSQDGAFRFPFVSEGCREIYEGWEPEQIMADARAILSYVHDDDAASFFSTIGASAQSLMPWEWEGRIQVPGRDLKWIRGTSRPKLEANGEIVWDGILIDINERKRQESLLQSAKSEAEIAREEAERANLAKSEFLSRMSHELRTPLNAILGFGQLLEMAPLEEEDQESAGQIVKAGRHLLDLINEVLDIARIEAGELSLSPEAINVREAALETLDLVRPLAAARGITLDEVAIQEAGDLWVRADRQRLKQVLLNLLSNAIKYNSEAGLVTLSCQPQGVGRLRIGVRDSGAGIAPGLRSRLFTAFDRLGAENSDIEGTGVGLALSRHLTQVMEGTLEFESRIEGEDGSPESEIGTVFWIELPRADDPLQRLADWHALPGASDMVNTQLVVLYIEDNPSNLQLVQRILARRPEIRLLTAMQGGMGVELARQHAPDLILLDMNLPDVSGAEVLRILREDDDTKAIPVVVVSADATQKQIDRMIEAGAERYLTKPFDVRELLSILDRSAAKVADIRELSAL